MKHAWKILNSYGGLVGRMSPLRVGLSRDQSEILDRKNVFYFFQSVPQPQGQKQSLASILSTSNRGEMLTTAHQNCSYTHSHNIVPENTSPPLLVGKICFAIRLSVIFSSWWRCFNLIP
jgi:hypothetical protein